MNAVLAIAIITSPVWLMLPLAVLGERTPTGRRIASAIDARYMDRWTR